MGRGWRRDGGGLELCYDTVSDLEDEGGEVGEGAHVGWVGRAVLVLT